MAKPAHRDYRSGHDVASLAQPAIALAADEQTAGEYQRAEMRARASSNDPLADLLEELGGSDTAAAVLRQFMLFCLPPKNYGDSRRFKSGFYRMVAFAWRIAPELLDGCRTDKDVADRLGVSPPAFFKHLESVDRVLCRGGAVVPIPGRPRVLPRPPGQ